mmetsp:Transcript_26536/g.41174  ORF Transcript_26536/g.41174 Transcript_26536/m.41174 type:complete len:80 (-) Transcript_26536:18-257(-)
MHGPCSWGGWRQNQGEKLALTIDCESCAVWQLSKKRRDAVRARRQGVALCLLPPCMLVKLLDIFAILALRTITKLDNMR